jgi:glutathione S-transferase
MAGTGDHHQLRLGDFGDVGSGARIGEQRALAPAHDEGGTGDAGERRQRSARHAEPAGVELEGEAAVGQRLHRIFRDRLAPRLAGVDGRGQEPEAADGLFAGAVAAADTEGAPRGIGGGQRGAARHVEEREPANPASGGRMLEGHASAEGMAHQDRRRTAEIGEQRGQIVGEGAHLEGFRMIRIAVTPEVEGDDVEAPRQRLGLRLPPVDVGGAAMQQHHQRACRITALQRVERHALELGSCEASAARRHAGESSGPSVYTAPMPELLFHHYDGSPFSEKIRLIFGYKGLAWRSVVQPNMLPKPHLLPLTGGYRRTPVLQIGADVYCDTQLIVRVLEALHPTPTLYPGGSEGISHMVNLWADRLLFRAAVPVVFGKIGAAVPKEFIEDRTRLMGGTLDFGAVLKAGPMGAEQLRAHAALLDVQLADGRPFLLGAAPGLCDFSAYHPVWFLRSLPPTTAAFDEFPRVVAWAERVKAIGHGRRSECPPEEALRVAREAAPAPPGARDPGEPNGLAPGDRVRVLPDDYGFDPVEGVIVSSSVHEIAVRRSTPETGEVVTHFPRAGFQVLRS